MVLASDLTFFSPNSMAAVTEMTSIAEGLNKTQSGALFAYHCVPSVMYSNGLKDGMKLKTLQGQELTISVVGDDIYVNHAKILTSNNLIANGVLHTVDK